MTIFICMTMKLMNLLKEDYVDYQPLNDLQYNYIPFEYGDVHLKYGYEIYGKFNYPITLPISIILNKIEPDMFDKAYLAYAQKIKSLFGDKFNLENIKLKIDDWMINVRMFGVLTMDITPYLSDATIHTLRNDKPTVEKILKGGYHVEVDMGSFPHIMDDSYDMVKKKEGHGKSVFEFLEDGTLRNGTSYKLIFESIVLFHHHKKSSGRHLDYSDIGVALTVDIDSNHPLTDDEKDELKNMFKMYDVILLFKGVYF